MPHGNAVGAEPSSIRTFPDPPIRYLPMSSTPPSYIIAGGQSGKSRLNVLAKVLRPHTESLLDSLGAPSWRSFLDVGCGGGDVAVTVARKLGPSSQVLGVDADGQIIALAEADRDTAGLDHLQYRHLDAYSLDFDGHFDAAYARFLLSHLPDPKPVMRNMAQAARPGGWVVVEDLEFSGHFSRPPHPAFDRYLDIYSQTVRARGGNPEIGAELVGLFREAGLEDVGSDVVRPAFGDGEGKWMAWLTLDRIRASAVAEGVVTETEVSGLLDELRTHTLDPDSVMSLPKITRVYGKRPGRA